MMKLLPVSAILHALSENAPQVTPAEALATFLAALQGRMDSVEFCADMTIALGTMLENTPFAPALYQAVLDHFGAYSGFKDALRRTLPETWEVPKDLSLVPPDSTQAAWYAAYVFTKCFDAKGQKHILQKYVTSPGAIQ